MKKRKVGFLVHPGWNSDCIEYMSDVYDEEIKEYDEVHVFMPDFKRKYSCNKKVSMYSMGNIELTSFLFARKNKLDIENSTFTVFGEYGNQCVDYFRRSFLVEFKANLKVNKSKCLFFKGPYDDINEEHIYSSCDNKYIHNSGVNNE